MRLPSSADSARWSLGSNGGEANAGLAPTTRSSAESSSPPTGTAGCERLGSFWASNWSRASAEVAEVSRAESLSLRARPASTSAVLACGSRFPCCDVRSFVRFFF